MHDASVVVVTHNGLTFSRLCLETVLANTAGHDFELIVIDNGSDDGTRAYLSKLADRDARVRVRAGAARSPHPRAAGARHFRTT